VTTASKGKNDDSEKPLPAPRTKQADNLPEKIKWMATAQSRATHFSDETLFTFGFFWS
jgi:hypothetical protein